MNRQVDIRDEHLSISSLFSLFWYFKFLFLFVGIFSLFVSLWIIDRSPLEYEAVAVIKLEDDNLQGESPLNMLASSSLVNATGGLSNILSDTLSSPLSNDIAPIILGQQFLSKFIEKEDVRRSINDNGYCRPQTHSGLSLTGLLSRWGYYEIKDITELQLRQQKYKCLQKMISLEKYEYKDMKSDSVKVKVSSNNPFFSSFLANKLVEEFFDYSEDIAKKDFENNINYISEIMGSTQVDVENTNRLLTAFLLENPQLAVGDEDAALAKSGVLELINLNRQELLIQRALVLLRKYSDEKNLSLIDLKKELAIFPFLSREFVADLQSLADTGVLGENEKDEFDQKIFKEIERLRSISFSIIDLKSQVKGSTDISLEASLKFNELRSNLIAKQALFKSLQVSLQSLTIKSGMVELSKNKLFTAATPPPYPKSPNNKVIIAITGLVGTLLLAVLLIVRQLLSERVYKKSQLFRLFDFADKVSSMPLVDLSKNEDLSKEFDFNQRNLNFALCRDLMNMGNVGCFIDVTNKGIFRANVAKLASTFFGKLLLAQGVKSVCVMPDKFEKDRYFSRGSNVIAKEILPSMSNKDKLAGLYFNNDGHSLLNKMQLFPLKTDFKVYDKLFLSLSDSKSDIIKQNAIEESDFFVLVGRVGKFNIDGLSKYLDKDEFRSKCAGFILCT